MLRPLLACALALSAAWAHAGMGMARLDGLQGDREVIVYYPTAAADQPTQRGPFTIAMAPEAQPERGNGRLVVISHGSGGIAWVHADLARELVKAGFVVALPHPRGDHAMDSADPGPQSWKLRPAEVSRAIDAVGQDARFAPLLSLDKVGVFGQSAGGHTALTLAGGRWSPGLFKKHCDAHIAEDFNACVGTFTQLHGSWLDGLKKTVALGVLRQRFDDDTLVGYTDPRIAAAVAGVPAAADFDHASLANPKVPLGLVTAGRDPWLAPRFHSDRVLAACQPRCELLANVPQGGHSILLGPMPPMDVLGEVERNLLADPPGFDRKELPEVNRKIVAFFQKHLR
jgi:predicted dienelactone hydrolase